MHPTTTSQARETLHIPLTPLPSTTDTSAKDTSQETAAKTDTTPTSETPTDTAKTETPKERRKRIKRREERAKEAARKKESKRDGFLSVGARPWGSVYINGHRAARETPLSRKRLKAGSYTVKVIFPSLGGRVRSKRITIKGGEHTSTFFSP